MPAIQASRIVIMSLVELIIVASSSYCPLLLLWLVSILHGFFVIFCKIIAIAF